MSDLIYPASGRSSPNPPLQRTRAGCAGAADSSVCSGRRSPLNGKPLGRRVSLSAVSARSLGPQQSTVAAQRPAFGGE
jgi:hypothetical protein